MTADVADIPQSTETFYFLKPTDSQRFLQHFGTKGMRVPTADEARRRLDEIVAAGMSVVLQEYIPGSFNEHYFVDGYVDRSGAGQGALRPAAPAHLSAGLRQQHRDGERGAGRRRAGRRQRPASARTRSAIAASSRPSSSAIRATASSSCSK